MSVCLYAIITAENVTWTMNTSRHFAFESTLVMLLSPTSFTNFLWYFIGGQPVFICVSTGPLALTKIFFLSVCTLLLQAQNISAVHANDYVDQSNWVHMYSVQLPSMHRVCYLVLQKSQRKALISYTFLKKYHWHYRILHSCTRFLRLCFFWNWPTVVFICVNTRSIINV